MIIIIIIIIIISTASSRPECNRERDHFRSSLNEGGQQEQTHSVCLVMVSNCQWDLGGSESREAYDARGSIVGG